MEASIDELKSLLTEKSLRITHQRLQILKILKSTYSHPTAEEIYLNLKTDFPTMSFATVYKTLDTLAKHDIIRKIKTNDQSVHFDADTSHHHHMLCLKTNKIIDYRDEKLDMMLHEYFENKRIKGFKINDVKIRITGEIIN